MARGRSLVNMYYTIEVETVLLGHHIYKEQWNPKLNCVNDTSAKTTEDSQNAVSENQKQNRDYLDMFQQRLPN